MFHRGFSLVELVVVILILGILAGIAAPKLLDVSDTASDNSLKRTLAVVRDAIELYAAEHNGALPGASEVKTDFKADLAPYLRGDFPACPVGPETSRNARVKFSDNDPLVGSVGDNTGWLYNGSTGEFICNNENPTASDPGVNYDDL